jgi:hypothetical protein
MTIAASGTAEGAGAGEKEGTANFTGFSRGDRGMMSYKAFEIMGLPQGNRRVTVAIASDAAARQRIAAFTHLHFSLN